MSASIFVGNLSYQTTEADLVRFFGAVGGVTSAKIPLDRESGRSRGFGFVEFESEDAADRAIAECHDAELGGRKLRVNKAEARAPRPGGPRPGGPRPDGPRPDGPRPAGARAAGRRHEPSSSEDSPELDFSREDRSGHGRRDDWRSLRGKKRTL